MYAVTCSDEDTCKQYLLDVATTEDRVLKLTEYKSLGIIKSAIQGQMCLSKYPQCIVTIEWWWVDTLHIDHEQYRV